jgi:hypothetical protein
MRFAHASRGGRRKIVNARRVGMGNRRAGDLAAYFVTVGCGVDRFDGDLSRYEAAVASRVMSGREGTGLRGVDIWDPP